MWCCLSVMKCYMVGIDFGMSNMVVVYVEVGFDVICVFDVE